jgi:cell wall-associated NlpC family hydrolase
MRALGPHALALLSVTAITACGSSVQVPTLSALQPATHRPRLANKDTEIAESFALSKRRRGARLAAAPSTHAQPAASATSAVAEGAPSDAEVRRELAEMRRALASEQADASAGTLLLADGHAAAPFDAPAAVAAVVAGANAIARFPYVYGGGHRSFIDSAYDCSGSVSYALAAAGLLEAPLSSGQLERWGEPGPGRWITVYANAGHTFMYVGGLRFDTSGRGGVYGSRWQAAPRSLAGFTARHWPGL